jgi:hypothetical protein
VAINHTASILASVHAVQSALSTESEAVCASPICLKRFKPGGLRISPRKFCSARCRQNASVIKRAARLLVGAPEKVIIDVLLQSR